MPLAALSLIGPHNPALLPALAALLSRHAATIHSLHHQLVGTTFLLDASLNLPDSWETSGDSSGGDSGGGDDSGGGSGGLAALARQFNAHHELTLDAPRPRIALLVSKDPEPLEQLLADHHAGRLHADVDVILSNLPDLAPIARRAAIPFDHHPSDDKPAHMRWLDAGLRQRGIDLVALARYRQFIPPQIVRRFRGPFHPGIISVHPTLLPHFPGHSPYREAWAAGARLMGVTAHFVTEVLDEGPIILQDTFPIAVGRDSPDAVRRHGLSLEGRLLAAAVALCADHRLAVAANKVLPRPGLQALFSAP